MNKSLDVNLVIPKIQDIIRDYHFCLDQGYPPDLNARINAIQYIVGMPYVDGAETKRREEKNNKVIKHTNFDIGMLRNPNLVGEALREIIFPKTNSYGLPELYGLVNMREGFVEINADQRLTDANKKDLFNRHYEAINKIFGDDYPSKIFGDDYPPCRIYSFYNEKEDILVVYYSDGDTTLYIKCGDIEVINTDAKKERNWQWMKDYNANR
jgi:hypothetical protein